MSVSFPGAGRPVAALRTCALGLAVLACGLSAGAAPASAAGSGLFTSAPSASPEPFVAAPSATPAPLLPSPPGPPAPPATSAGALRAADLLPAAALGPRWRPYADPGGVEAGFEGNGSWVRARQARDVVDGLAPLGCLGLPPRTPALPRPTAALEGTYVSVGGQGRGVSLVLEFATAAQAQVFFTAQQRLVTACGRPRLSVARATSSPASLAITPHLVRAELVVDDRVEYGVDASPLVWHEVIVRRGTRVSLLTLGTAAGDQPVAPLQAATRMRAALG